MKLRRHQRLVLCGSLLVVGQCALADSLLDISAQTPEIQIQPRASSSGFMLLPKLAYTFDVDAQCAQEMKPVSLLISVADTRKMLTGEAIGDDPAIVVTLDVPADQIAPIAIRDFCMITSSSDATVEPALTGSGSRNLPAILSAQASMRCAAVMEESTSDPQMPHEETVYASTPLNVILNCQIPEPSVEESIR